jgi:Flp pilus assembly protein TadD
LLLKRLGEAEQAFRFVLSEQPDHTDAHRCLAAIYYDQGAWLAAVQHLREVARLDPEDGRPFRFMGLIYKDLDQPNLAVPSYRDALKRRLTDVVGEEVQDELAECLVLQAHYAEALEILEQRSPLGTALPKLTALRAECLWGLGRATEAEPLLDQALQEHPRSPELLRVRAKTLLAVGKSAAAATLLERVLEIDPNDFKSRHQLAQAYEGLGRRAEAAEQRQRVKQTQDQLQELTRLTQEAKDKPWDAPLRRRLADLCHRLNRPDLAAMWQRAAAACPPAKAEEASSKGSE